MQLYIPRFQDAAGCERAQPTDNLMRCLFRRESLGYNGRYSLYSSCSAGTQGQQNSTSQLTSEVASIP